MNVGGTRPRRCRPRHRTTQWSGGDDVMGVAGLAATGTARLSSSICPSPAVPPPLSPAAKLYSYHVCHRTPRPGRRVGERTLRPPCHPCQLNRSFHIRQTAPPQAPEAAHIEQHSTHSACCTPVLSLRAKSAHAQHRRPLQRRISMRRDHHQLSSMCISRRRNTPSLRRS